MKRLRKYKLIRSRKGTSGGYLLAKPPEDIQLFSILIAVTGARSKSLKQEPVFNHLLVEITTQTSLADLVHRRTSIEKAELAEPVEHHPV